MNRVIFLLSFLMCCVVTTIKAQQFNDKQVQLIDGKTYYLHKIEKGNTLYSLSKMYSIKIKDLIAENSQLNEGLKVGQVIRIPVKKIDAKTAGKNPPKAQGKYLLHTVAKKETLYSLSRKYDIDDIQRISELNPQVKDGLKIGMQLRIPMPSTGVEGSLIQPAEEDSFVMHLVEPKETLYSLAKEYNVNIDSIRLINGGLPDGLKVGTTIRLPILNDKFSTNGVNLSDVSADRMDSAVFKEEYQVVIMMPFYLDLNDTLEKKRLDYEKERIHPDSKVALSIYTGIKIALDSLKSKGYKFNVRVYDTHYDRVTKSTQPVKDFLLDQELVNTDLFIGPLFKPNYDLVKAYAAKIGASIITPVSQDLTIVNGYERSIKLHSSKATQVDYIRDFSLRNFKDANLILVENNELKDVLLVERFKGIDNGDTNSAVFNPVTANFKSLKIWGFDTARIRHSLDDSIPNVLVLPLNSKSFVTRMLTGLNRYSKDYDITVIGMDKWSTFGYIDYKYFNNLKVHMPMNQFVDYQQGAVELYLQKYREVYHTDPNKWAFLGYDMGLYFLESLQKFGTGFCSQWPLKRYKGLSKDFQFQRVSEGSGFENIGIKMVKMENYFNIIVE